LQIIKSKNTSLKLIFALRESSIAKEKIVLIILAGMEDWAKKYFIQPPVH